MKENLIDITENKEQEKMPKFFADRIKDMKIKKETNGKIENIVPEDFQNFAPLDINELETKEAEKHIKSL